MSLPTINHVHTYQGADRSSIFTWDWYPGAYYFDSNDILHLQAVKCDTHGLGLVWVNINFASDPPTITAGSAPAQYPTDCDNWYTTNDSARLGNIRRARNLNIDEDYFSVFREMDPHGRAGIHGISNDFVYATGGFLTGASGADLSSTLGWAFIGYDGDPAEPAGTNVDARFENLVMFGGTTNPQQAYIQTYQLVKSIENNSPGDSFWERTHYTNYGYGGVIPDHDRSMGIVPIGPNSVMTMYQDISGDTHMAKVDFDLGSQQWYSVSTGYDLDTPLDISVPSSAYMLFNGDDIYIVGGSVLGAAIYGTYSIGGSNIEFSKYSLNAVTSALDLTTGQVTFLSKPRIGGSAVKIVASVKDIVGNDLSSGTPARITITSSGDPLTDEDGAVTVNAGDTAFDANGVPVSTSAVNNVDETGAVTFWYHPPRSGQVRGETFDITIPYVE